MLLINVTTMVIHVCWCFCWNILRSCPRCYAPEWKL